VAILSWEFLKFPDFSLTKMKRPVIIVSKYPKRGRSLLRADGENEKGGMT
jgi:hypothetical protein